MTKHRGLAQLWVNIILSTFYVDVINLDMFRSSASDTITDINTYDVFTNINGKTVVSVDIVVDYGAIVDVSDINFCHLCNLWNM